MITSIENETGLSVLGTPDSDFIFTDDGDDFIWSHEGADFITTGGGNDLVRAGDGNDYVDAGTGKDVAFGEDGNDLLVGAGSAWLDGGAGDDRVVGVDADVGTGIAHHAWLFGGSGDDVVSAGRLTLNVLSGDAGNDWLWGGSFGDTLSGGAGNDVLLGGPGADTLFDTEGNNVFSGGPGDDTFWAGDGDDLIFSGGWAGGQDFSLLFAGDDSKVHAEHGSRDGHVYYSAYYMQAPDVIDPPWSGGDTIHAGGGNDVIYCGQGSDLIRDGAGDDFVSGGWGRNELFMGPGVDVYDLAGSQRVWVRITFGTFSDVRGGGSEKQVTLHNPDIIHYDAPDAAGAGSVDYFRGFDPNDGDRVLYNPAYGGPVVFTGVDGATWATNDHGIFAVFEGVNAAALAAAFNYIVA
ncbi:MAG: hypothetical protein HY778_06420 [Betaproteobacteria bacterium]|nr:hypothetical protein [Betaproteobacteria bacterium]